MRDWYASIYKGFIAASIVSFIIGFFTQGNTSLGAYISGYSILILAIMMILIILFNNILTITEGQSTLKLLYTILFSTGPFLLMLSVILFILCLTLMYKDNIIEKHVSNNYYSFSNIFIILLLMQLYIFYTTIKTEKFEITGKMPKLLTSIVYLLGVLSMICSIIIFTILKYFNTDGFTTGSTLNI